MNLDVDRLNNDEKQRWEKKEGGKLILLTRFEVTERTILISRTTRTRSNTIMILQRGIQTWIDVVVTSFHVRRRLAQVFFNKQT